MPKNTTRNDSNDHNTVSLQTRRGQGTANLLAPPLHEPSLAEAVNDLDGEELSQSESREPLELMTPRRPSSEQEV